MLHHQRRCFVSLFNLSLFTAISLNKETVLYENAKCVQMKVDYQAKKGSHVAANRGTGFNLSS
jgi:hypothetical protein